MLKIDQYIDVFIDESTEHIDVLYNQLIELEKQPTKKTTIEEIFRAAHTIKGMSATMGYKDMTDLTHYLENIFDGIRYGRITVQANTIDLLFSAVDDLNKIVEDIADGGDGKRNVDLVVSQLVALEEGVMDPKKGLLLNEFELAILKESNEKSSINYEITVIINQKCILKSARAYMVFGALEQLGEVIKSDPSVSDLEQELFDHSFTVLLISKQTKDEISRKIKKVSDVKDVVIKQIPVASYRIKQEEKVVNNVFGLGDGEENNKSTTNNRQTSRKTIRVNIERLDLLMNLFEELVIDREHLEQIALEVEHHDLKETVERMTRVTGDLQDVILNMRMVPINQVFNRFPRTVRQIARDLHKKINLEIIGGDTELDRTVIEEIGEPLVHLIRNATDHGIELPEERKKMGKPEHGTIKLQAYPNGNQVFIEIDDNGAGINKELVLDKAIKKGIISPEQSEVLTEPQVYELIMASGFSTTEVISDVSGRGVGLDVVKNTIETLGGSISIHSEMGVGTLFSIQLPLT